MQDIPELCHSTMKTGLKPFREVLKRVNGVNGSPPVSCIISDGVMSFTLDAAEEMGLPEVLFWTTSACGLMGYLHYSDLIKRGITPWRGNCFLLGILLILRIVAYGAVMTCVYY